MLIPVSLFLALALAVFSYSQGQGGPVAGLVFFGVLFLLRGFGITAGTHAAYDVLVGLL